MSLYVHQSKYDAKCQAGSGFSPHHARISTIAAWFFCGGILKNFGVALLRVESSSIKNQILIPVKNRALCVLLIVLIAGSCKKDEAVENAAPPASNTPGYKEYIIPKGDHYALQNDFRPTRIRQLKFSVLFDSSCIYSTTKAYNTEDVNKLYGFSDCNTQHHLNSARFGWRWTGRELEILAYCYADSVRQIKPLGVIAIGKPAEMSICVEAENYVFELNGSAALMQRRCSTEYAEGYQLYPYFGGDEVAPHEVRIRIRENNL